MIVLCYDTETTGLPQDRWAAHTDTKKWPHIIQLSWISYDTETNTVIGDANDLIQINDLPLSDESVAIHKITREKANAEGIPICDAMEKFIQATNAADCMVGHNTQFDRNIVSVEGIRHGFTKIFRSTDGSNKPEYCTMQKGKTITKIEKINQTTGRTYFKQPRLAELHDYLYGDTPEGTHDAMVDVLVCLRCYMAIRWDVADVLESSPDFARVWEAHIE